MGGNIFQNTTTIKKENITFTVEAYIQEMRKMFSWFPETSLLGSAGKKDISGDIDMAVDMSILRSNARDTFGNSTIQKTFEVLKNRSRTSSDEQLEDKAILQLMGGIISSESSMIKVDEKKIGLNCLFSCFPIHDENGITEEWVQVDWLVGNIEWLNFSYYSDVYDENVRGLHRTQLMLATFKAFDLSFIHGSGIKNSKHEFLASTPREAIYLLNGVSGAEFNQDILSNFFLLYNHIEKYLFTKDIQKIKNIYLSILDKTRCDIPECLQDYWSSHKEDLKLTGKFLPADSNLYHN